MGVSAMSSVASMPSDDCRPICCVLPGSLASRDSSLFFSMR
ncbi:Uncharacterised protein [Mycobacterium tuberculosis]|nr:Uncharacterised protein [Mycobacterium tuberculosis]